MRKIKNTNKNPTKSQMIKWKISMHKIIIIDFELEYVISQSKKEETNWIENRKTIEQAKILFWKYQQNWNPLGLPCWHSG